MNAVNELLGSNVDEHGIAHIGLNTGGCPHCGATEAKQAENGKAVLYHPGAECCTARLTDQITWREQEIADVQKSLNERYEAVDRLDQLTQEAYGKEAQKLEGQARRSRKALEDYVLPALREKAADLEEERARLQKKRGWLARKEQAA